MRRRNVLGRGTVASEQEPAGLHRSNPAPKVHCAAASSDSPSASFYDISRCFWNGIEGYNPKTAPSLSLTLTWGFACRRPPAARLPAAVAATGSGVSDNFDFLKIDTFTFPREQLKRDFESHHLIPLHRLNYISNLMIGDSSVLSLTEFTSKALKGAHLGQSPRK